MQQQGRAIIIGASSGIGLEIARRHLAQGWQVAVAARRVELLREIFGSEIPEACIVEMDASAENAPQILEQLLAELGGAERIYFSSGMGELNAALEWAPEEATIALNVTGFARLANAAMHAFERQGAGHFVGISSIAALRGAAAAPAYGASKAFMSRYLQALRQRAKESQRPIFVTDVRPGFVDTPMMKADKTFWVASAEKAARQVIAAADRKAGVAYVTRCWASIGWLLKWLPE